jgi:class 3 adenylate cyclase/CheY-like chemotaxis protein
MAGRPTGTITLLFTDVEGSTLLVQRLGEAYGDVLGAKRGLIRGAIHAAGGYEVDARGDEMFVLFQDAADAAAGAVGAQQALAAATWPDGVQVRVRMGLHTGEPAVSYEDDYVGVDVNRAARICAAGHGGQILLSRETRDMLDGLAVTDLGVHRLAGLAEPERLYQLDAPGLPSSFPPLRAPRAGDAVRVLLADDSVLLREGIARLLEDSGFDVVGQVGTADDLLEEIPRTKPNVAIVDIRMPPTHTNEGLRAAAEIRERHPEVAVLVLSQHVEEAYALDLLSENRTGVGYLLKDRVADVEEFAASVRRVTEGGLVLDQEVKARLAGDSDK